MEHRAAMEDKGIEYIITTHNLCKTYRQAFGAESTALVDVSLEVRRGEIFGIIGPNGSGKTTFFYILLGFIHQSSGKFRIFGEYGIDVHRLARIGFMPEEFSFYNHLTGRSMLHLFGAMDRVPPQKRQHRIEELLQSLDLKKHENKRLKGYSKGMLQRICLAQALIGQPELLMLDEPTSGLDPMAKVKMRELLKKEKELGRTIVISSHQLSEIELIADRVAIISQARLIRTDTVENIRRMTDIYILTFSNVDETTIEALKHLGDNLKMLSQGRYSIQIHTREKAGEAIDLVRAAKGTIESLTPLGETLEESFIEIIKQQSD